MTYSVFKHCLKSNLTLIAEPILDNYRQTDTLMSKPRTAHPRRSRTSIEDSQILSSSNSAEDLTVDGWGRPITQNVTENDSFQSGKSEKGSTDDKEKIENMPVDFGGKMVYDFKFRIRFDVDQLHSIHVNYQFLTENHGQISNFKDSP